MEEDQALAGDVTEFKRENLDLGFEDVEVKLEKDLDLNDQEKGTELAVRLGSNGPSEDMLHCPSFESNVPADVPVVSVKDLDSDEQVNVTENAVRFGINEPSEVMLPQPSLEAPTDVTEFSIKKEFEDYSVVENVKTVKESKPRNGKKLTVAKVGSEKKGKKILRHNNYEHVNNKQTKNRNRKTVSKVGTVSNVGSIKTGKKHLQQRNSLYVNNDKNKHRNRNTVSEVGSEKKGKKRLRKKNSENVKKKQTNKVTESLSVGGGKGHLIQTRTKRKWENTSKSTKDDPETTVKKKKNKSPVKVENGGEKIQNKVKTEAAPSEAQVAVQSVTTKYISTDTKMLHNVPVKTFIPGSKLVPYYLVIQGDGSQTFVPGAQVKAQLPTFPVENSVNNQPATVQTRGSLSTASAPFVQAGTQSPVIQTAKSQSSTGSLELPSATKVKDSNLQSVTSTHRVDIQLPSAENIQDKNMPTTERTQEDNLSAPVPPASQKQTYIQGRDLQSTTPVSQSETQQATASFMSLNVLNKSQFKPSLVVSDVLQPTLPTPTVLQRSVAVQTPIVQDTGNNITKPVVLNPSLSTQGAAPLSSTALLSQGAAHLPSTSLHDSFASCQTVNTLLCSQAVDNTHSNVQKNFLVNLISDQENEVRNAIFDGSTSLYKPKKKVVLILQPQPQPQRLVLQPQPHPQRLVLQPQPHPQRLVPPSEGEVKPVESVPPPGKSQMTLPVSCVEAPSVPTGGVSDTKAYPVTLIRSFLVEGEKNLVIVPQLHTKRKSEPKKLCIPKQPVPDIATNKFEKSDHAYFKADEKADVEGDEKADETSDVEADEKSDVEADEQAGAPPKKAAKDLEPSDSEDSWDSSEDEYFQKKKCDKSDSEYDPENDKNRSDNECWSDKCNTESEFDPEERYEAKRHGKIFMACGATQFSMESMYPLLVEEKEDGSYVCKNCGVSSENQNEAVVHMREHRPFNCINCNIKFISFVDLINHRKKEHKQRWYCSKCSYNTSTQTDLHRHMKTEHDTGLVVVEKVENLKDHIRWICHVCGIFFWNFVRLEAHMKKTHDMKPHSREGDWECPVCSSVCTSNRVLKEHLLKHLGKFIYCSVEGCTYKHVSKYSISSHMKLVHQDKTLACPFEGCDMKVSCKGNLECHLNTVHYKDRKYKCTYCGKGFLASKHLTVHLRIHTDEKPVSCKYCEYRCRQKAALMWHMNKQHPDKDLGPTKTHLHRVRPGRKPKPKNKKGTKAKDEETRTKTSRKRTSSKKLQKTGDESETDFLIVSESDEDEDTKRRSVKEKKSRVKRKRTGKKSQKPKGESEQDFPVLSKSNEDTTCETVTGKKSLAKRRTTKKIQETKDDSENDSDEDNFTVKKQKSLAKPKRKAKKVQEVKDKFEKDSSNVLHDEPDVITTKSQVQRERTSNLIKQVPTDKDAAEDSHGEKFKQELILKGKSDSVSGECVEPATNTKRNTNLMDCTNRKDTESDEQPVKQNRPRRTAAKRKD